MSDKIEVLLTEIRDAIRGAFPAVKPKTSEDGRFIDCGDGTIKDTLTGLMWDKDGSDNSMSQSRAEEYCKKSEVGGHKDWRLPTREELESILDLTKVYPAIDPIFNCKSAWYWTSTPYAGNSGSAWFVGFSTGSVLWNLRSYYFYVRPVRQY